MKVLCCGPREWDNFRVVEKTLRDLGPTLEAVIEGDANGADKISGWVAENKLGVPVKKYPADWAKHGKRAGPVRNREMFDSERPDLVVAFINDYNEAKRLHESGEHRSGTVDMVEYARSQGCTTVIVSEEG